MVKPQVWFELEIGGRPVGRVEFELFSDVVPRTAENFRCLATGEYGGGLHYEGCRFHRVVRQFVIQGGDVTRGDGTGGESIYGGDFEDENLSLKHDEPYLLSMANRGPNTNSSQFFVTLRPAPHLDGRHVVFGRVKQGAEVFETISKVAVDRNDRPLVEVTVAASGSEHPVRAAAAPEAQPPLAAVVEEAVEEAFAPVLDAPVDEPPTVEDLPADDAERRLFAVKLALGKARKDNADRAAEERERKQDERRRGVGARERAQDRAAAKAKFRADLEKRNMGGREHLLDTAQAAARYQDKVKAKNQRKAAFGWEVFNADSLHKAYEKRLGSLPVGRDDDVQDLDPTAYGQEAHPQSEDALDRMVDELDQRQRQRQLFSRRRAFLPEADVDYINDRNRHFNKKIKRAFDKFTVEIRQNLERGTAV